MAGKRSDMLYGTLKGICISPVARGPMVEVQEVVTIPGLGLEGDRYSTFSGSYNKGEPGKRQITIVGTHAFEGSDFTHRDSRRNLLIEFPEPIRLIGMYFQIGDAAFEGEKYCPPCSVPDSISRKKGFKRHFAERGGIIAKVLNNQNLRVGDELSVDLKSYK